MSGGGANQLSPRQALPRTINLAILNHANRWEGRGKRAARRRAAGRVIEGGGLGCHQLAIVYVHRRRGAQS